MSDPVPTQLTYCGGRLELTDSHLLVLLGERLESSFALRHLYSVSVEEAHSCPHRVLATIAALVFMVPITIILLPEGVAGRLEALAQIRGKFGLLLPFAVLFAGIFGVVMLWGVVTSRRIWWIRARYGKTDKFIPLPDVEHIDLESFVQLVVKEVERLGQSASDG